MNTDTKLQKCTTPFKDYLLKDLAQPEFAKGYLEAALQDSETLDSRKQKCYTSSKQKHFSSQGNGKHVSQHHKGRKNGIF